MFETHSLLCCCCGRNLPVSWGWCKQQPCFIPAHTACISAALATGDCSHTHAEHVNTLRLNFSQTHDICTLSSSAASSTPGPLHNTCSQCTPQHELRLHIELRLDIIELYLDALLACPQAPSGQVHGSLHSPHVGVVMRLQLLQQPLQDVIHLHKPHCVSGRHNTIQQLLVSTMRM